MRVFPPLNSNWRIFGIPSCPCGSRLDSTCQPHGPQAASIRDPRLTGSCSRTQPNVLPMSHVVAFTANRGTDLQKVQFDPQPRTGF